MVIGTGGMIGDAIAARLATASLSVVAVSRTGNTGSDPRLLYVRADRARPRMIVDLIAEHAIDVIVDVVAYTTSETQRLLSMIDGKISRYVLLSSSDVYRNYGLLHRKETGEAIFDLIDEDSPLRQSLYPYLGPEPRTTTDPEQWMDAYNKIPIEAVTRDMATNWTILRLPMVYGPGDRQKRFGWAILPMLAKTETLDLPENWANWTTTYGYIDNVAAAIGTAILSPNAENRIFNITDTDPVSNLAWAGRFQKELGWPGLIQISADEKNPIASATSDLDLSIPLKLSGRQLRENLAFKPQVTLAESIQRTIDAERILMEELKE